MYLEVNDLLFHLFILFLLIAAKHSAYLVPTVKCNFNIISVLVVCVQRPRSRPFSLKHKQNKSIPFA